MKVNIIYKDERKVVKAVWYGGEFFYTRTYLLDEDGFVERDIQVFADGTVTIRDTEDKDERVLPREPKGF